MKLIPSVAYLKFIKKGKALIKLGKHEEISNSANIFKRKLRLYIFRAFESAVNTFNKLSPAMPSAYIVRTRNLKLKPTTKIRNFYVRYNPFQVPLLGTSECFQLPPRCSNAIYI